MPDALIIFLGKYLIYLSVLLVVGYFLFFSKYKKEFALVTILSLVLAYALARVAGLFYSHAQPFDTAHFMPLIPHDVDNSFPSDHSALAGALAGVASLYNKYLGVVLWVLAVLVGAGRMLAGLHYPVDIVTGLIIGGLSVVLAKLLLILVLAKLRRAPHQQ